MDAPWIRSPPDADLEYIGADYSTLASDLDWTLDEDGLYLAPGVMRFRRGWTVFRDAAEQAFSVAYTIDCFGCVGPRAITKAIGARRFQLEQHGLSIVPSHVLYPRNWITAHELVRALPAGEAKKELGRLAKGSWSVHLFGKMTNHLRIQPGSIAAEAFTLFSLGVPRRTGRLSSADEELARAPSSWSDGPTLRLPETYRYRARTRLEQLEIPRVDLMGSLNGRFDGTDLISLRGCPRTSSAPNATLRLATASGGSITLTEGTGSSGIIINSSTGDAAPAGAESFEVRVAEGQANLRNLNALLRGILYTPPSNSDISEDVIQLAISWGEETIEGSIAVDLSPD